MKPKTLVSLVFVFVLVACTGSPQTTTTGTPAEITTTEANDADDRLPVIADYSPTVSDVGGLLYLLAHPRVDVLAITLSTTGEAGCDLGAEVTRGILAMLDRSEIPVACGQDFPKEANRWPAEFLAGHEDLLFGLPDSGASSGLLASELIIETLNTTDRKVAIWAVGPLTNIAEALEVEPELISRVERVYVMGGAIDAPGNVFDGPAEWNFYIDAQAASTVISSGIPVALVPLDATNHVPVPSWYSSALDEIPTSPEIAYLRNLARVFPAVTGGFYYFWDELAAVALTGDLGSLGFTTVPISVLVGGEDNGRTVKDEQSGSLVDVLTEPDPIAFYNHMLSTLSHQSVLLATGGDPAEVAYFEAASESLAPFRERVLALFSDPALSNETTYDAELFAVHLEGVMDALSEGVNTLETLIPPDSVLEAHRVFVDRMRAFLGHREEIIQKVLSANSFDEVGDMPGLDDFDSACIALESRADLIGIQVDLCEQADQ